MADLDDKTLEALLAPLDLRLRRVHPLDGRDGGRFRVESDGGQVFVRIDDRRREAELREEASLRWHLGSRRFPTPQPVRRPDGTPFVVAGEHRVSVYPWIGGAPVVPSDVTVEHASAVGQVLARLHVLGADFDTHRSVGHDPAVLAAALERQPAGAAELVAVLAEEASHVASMRAPDLPSGLVHDALVPNAVLWHGRQIVAVLDLAHAGVGSLVTDLALTILTWCTRGAHVDNERVRALVRGYDAERLLSRVERSALPIELRVANLVLAVREAGDRDGVATGRNRLPALEAIDAATVASWFEVPEERS